jgi:hypothetical protein
LIEHIDWSLELLHPEFICKAALVVVIEGVSWSLLDLVIGEGVLVVLEERLDWLVGNLVGS